MIWLFLALGAAICVGISDILTKKVLQKDDPYLVALGKSLFAVPFLLPILFFIDIPALDMTFLKTILILAPLELVAMIAYMKGIQKSPIALTVPFLSFSPVFMILTGFLILGESPTVLGIVGIFLVVIGAYVLNIKNWRRGLIAPFKAIFEEPGSVLLLITAFIYSITSVLGKKAVLHSSPWFFSGFYTAYLTIFLIPLAMWKSTSIKKIVKKPELLVVIGFLLAATAVMHFFAISMVKAAYMISVKRLSVVISTVLAYLVFREDHVVEHLIGAGLMFIGVVVILLLG